MDYSPESPAGQPAVTLSHITLEQVRHLCSVAQTTRGWYGHFEPTLREVDRVAAIKVHDLVTEAAILSRQLARALGFSLPSVEDLTWELSPRPASQPTEF